MTEHALKTAPAHFQALMDGTQTAELRKDDRGFAVGDTLLLREWDEAVAQTWHAAWVEAYPGAFTALAIERSLQQAAAVAYTGRTLRRTITHILRGGPWLAEGYAMLSLDVAAVEREACAKLVENHWPTGRASDMDTIAAAIRARGEL